MTVELTKEARAEAIASIERCFGENMEERIGSIAAGTPRGFLLEELGPSIHNKAVADVQEKLQMHVAEIDLEVHEDGLQYGFRQARAGRPARARR